MANQLSCDNCGRAEITDQDGLPVHDRPLFHIIPRGSTVRTCRHHDLCSECLEKGRVRLRQSLGSWHELESACPVCQERDAK